MSKVSPPRWLDPEVMCNKASKRFEEKNQIFGREHIKGGNG